MPSGSVHYLGGMAFQGEAASGHRVMLDAASEVGGHNQGFRPTELTAVSLAGCTAMDVVSILQKMRVTIEDFRVEVDAQNRPQHPRVFTHIRLDFRLRSPDCTAEQVKRAVALSAERYCSVSAMLEKTANIERHVFLNGEEV
jgi:putative redox protein